MVYKEQRQRHVAGLSFTFQQENTWWKWGGKFLWSWFGEGASFLRCQCCLSLSAQHNCISIKGNEGERTLECWVTADRRACSGTKGGSPKIPLSTALSPPVLWVLFLEVFGSILEVFESFLLYQCANNSFTVVWKKQHFFHQVVMLPLGTQVSVVCVVFISSPSCCWLIIPAARWSYDHFYDGHPSCCWLSAANNRTGMRGHHSLNSRSETLGHIKLLNIWLRRFTWCSAPEELMCLPTVPVLLVDH